MTTVAVGLELQGVLQYLSGSDADAALCANLAWAAINGHGAKAATLNANGSPVYELVGALNAKAGTIGQGLNGACNALAGTTGLEAQLALRTYAGLP